MRRGTFLTKTLRTAVKPRWRTSLCAWPSGSSARDTFSRGAPVRRCIRPSGLPRPPAASYALPGTSDPPFHGRIMHPRCGELYGCSISHWNLLPARRGRSRCVPHPRLLPWHRLNPAHTTNRWSTLWENPGAAHRMFTVHTGGLPVLNQASFYRLLYWFQYIKF